MEMPVTRSNKGPNTNGADPPAEQPVHTPQRPESNKGTNEGKTSSQIDLSPPVIIPVIPEIAKDTAKGEEAQALPKSEKTQIDKSMIAQMNLLTGTINAMSLQFHVIKQEIVQMSETLTDIKQQQFQNQIQSNRDDITSLENRVSMTEASLTFNDTDRAAIRDHIKRIEQQQKENSNKIRQVKESQPSRDFSCDCSKRIDHLETEARKKNIIIAGVIEHKEERLKHIVLEIVSNTNLPISYHDIDQATRVGPFKLRGPPRPILVKFRDVAARDDIMARRHLIKNNPNCSKIWINEDLPEKVKKSRYQMKILGDLAVSLGHQVILRGNNISIDGVTYNDQTLDTLPPHLSLERAFTRETPNGIAFHSEHSFLSSFHKTNIEFNNNKYCSAEQGIQHTKAKITKHENIAREIMQTDDPVKIKRLGDKIQRNEQWSKSEDRWVEEITNAKYDQNPKLADALVRTKQAPLLECTMSNHWGIGLPITHPDLYKRSFKPKGKNTLGKILEKKREDIRRTIASTPVAQQPPPPPLPLPLPLALTATQQPPPPPTPDRDTITTTTTTAAAAAATQNQPVTSTCPPPIPPRPTPPPAHKRPAQTEKKEGNRPALQPLDYRIPAESTPGKIPIGTAQLLNPSSPPFIPALHN